MVRVPLPVLLPNKEPERLRRDLACPDGFPFGGVGVAPFLTR
jgi:hypothetical protein